MNETIIKGLSERQEVINKMVKTNSLEYNIDKTIEELLELAEAMMKRKLKGDHGASAQDIIDELGDVQIRIDVMKEVMGKEAVEDRVTQKLDKFRGFYEQNKYIGHI